MAFSFAVMAVLPIDTFSPFSQIHRRSSPGLKTRNVRCFHEEPEEASFIATTTQGGQIVTKKSHYNGSARKIVIWLTPEGFELLLEKMGVKISRSLRFFKGLFKLFSALHSG